MWLRTPVRALAGASSVVVGYWAGAELGAKYFGFDSGVVPVMGFIAAVVGVAAMQAAHFASLRPWLREYLKSQPSSGETSGRAG